MKMTKGIRILAWITHDMTTSEGSGLCAVFDIVIGMDCAGVASMTILLSHTDIPCLFASLHTTTYSSTLPIRTLLIFVLVTIEFSRSYSIIFHQKRSVMKS